ncbi:adenylyl-sulfate reductase subunit alpha [Desulforamulus hydrothermalis]|uniref:Adenylylsulfate reductase, alpha subunit n=1 Tax=Desulforamulus hydrothermalis Lam5 = DSM 18033 TaxID=1121428 RepID=K8DZC0_9FIRM|nr:adenylyl-sulfate reductase subunit alpha [Desulforamulus hydrothermalis]CCO08305.1 Adenylylsulfate reductase, alpha subunit [Desulforamulus hydrothermalis Lam5 = DSM 18033]SHH45618.1 dissimilatory adenylylsulfate reductase alpha subunit precursor [Desulforamulus hydrothermalis Lam5 = DSM 18033]
MPNFETVVVNTDILILGGGMAACGAAVEASYWAKKNGLKVTLVDKAAMDRSGAVAMGLSAINQYLGIAKGENTVEDYVRYVKNDLMGIARDDQVADIARHVDSSVHLFEKWGLPIWKNEEGNYVRGGRWQIMLNGESYKIIVAEAAKNALGTENIYERVYICEPIMDGDRIAGAIGFSTREEKVYVFKAKAVIAAMGGAVGVFKPRSTGEGLGRSWYPPFSSGSSAYFTMKAGAEMTCQEVRFIPVRFKDAYGPVGAWFLLFKSRATNALGEEYMVTRKDELANWGPYGQVKPIPANLRNYLGMLDVAEGKGPIYMQTAEAIANLAKKYEDDPKAFKKKMKELESEAWEDFLDMTVSQAILWAACNIAPEEKASEIAAAEPYFIGSHSGASGAWVSGPADIAPPEYQWGYTNMTTVKGLFAAGDASGASSHKFSSGSHAEGRIAGKSAVRFVVENNQEPNIDDAAIEALKAQILKPLAVWEEFSGFTTDPETNPNYILPKQYMFRLQKMMDEYAGGVVANFTTSKALLEKGLEYLLMLKEDSEKLAARNLHELMRCWENIHRTLQAESHIRTVLFREETRWPGYYFRADEPKLKEEWEVFCNCKYDAKTGEWEMIKRPIIRLVD